MWLIIIAIVVVSWLVWKYGVFSTVQLYEDTLIKPQILYYSYRGSYKKLGDQFSYIEKCKQGFFKLSSGIGIYYSMPSNPEWDCVLGILVNQGESHNVRDFLDKNPKFKETKIGSIKYLGYTHPYVNMLTFFLMSLKVIPRFKELVKQKNAEPFRGLIQVYHFASEGGKRVELIDPMQKSESFQLFEQPEQ